MDRLVDYLHRVKGIGMKRSRISEIFLTEGLSWRHEETWFSERVDPDFAKKGGHRKPLHRSASSQCDGVSGPKDPLAVKSYPGKQLVDPEGGKQARRASQTKIDYRRRQKAGYVFGALQPRTGEVFTATSTRRRLVNWIGFLQQLEDWIPKEVERVYAVLDNLTTKHQLP